jgi:hypothetical protein
MAELIHAQAALDSPSVSNSTTLTTRLTLSSTDLSNAGFENDDEAIVIVWGCYHQANIATDQQWRLLYNGASLHGTTPFLASANFVNGGRTAAAMFRVDLGTLANFELQNARVNTSANVTIERARIIVLKAMDTDDGLGEEGVDWWWNESTTGVAHTTTYSGTNRAAITWTPASSTEDWLILCSDHIAIDSASVNCEGRVFLDGTTLVAGDYSEEGETTSEEWCHLFAGIMENLSTSSHTIAYQSRDDTATAANDHRRSALLLIRAGRWPDLKWDTPADNGLAADTNEIVANVTASLSEAQDALIIGSSRIDVGAADEQSWMWMEDNGTPIEPNLDGSSGTDSKGQAPAFDATDEMQQTWVGISARASGAQDLEMWVRCSSATPGNQEEIVLVLWGLELGAAAGTTVTASAFTVAASLPAAGVAAGANITATAISVPITLPQPTIHAAALVTPSAIGVPLSLPTAGVSVAPVIPASAIDVPLTLPAVSIVAESIIEALSINAVLSLPQPTITQDAIAAASAFTVPITLPAAGVQIPALIAASAFTVLTSIPVATISIPATATPAVIGIATSFPVPGIQAGSVVTPAAIVVNIAVPTPSIFAGVLAIIAQAFGQFQRFGSGRLHLSRVGRGGRRGFRVVEEGWERVSDVFVFDQHDEGLANATETMEAVAAAWAAHAGSSAATLTAEIHAALDALGYRRPDGTRLV